MDNRPPRERRERLANIHPRATKSHSWNMAKETAHPSVGRSLSAGHHRLILPLCRLRLNAPPQDRLHRSNVTMLARAKPNIPHREPLRTIHTVPNSLVLPPVDRVQSRLARLASLYPIHPLQTVLGSFQTPPRAKKRNSSKTIAPLWKNPQDGVFKWGFCLALLCKPPPKRITSHFVILPRQNCLFWHLYSLVI